jgi:hypothetical protein
MIVRFRFVLHGLALPCISCIFAQSICPGVLDRHGMMEAACSLAVSASLANRNGHPASIHAISEEPLMPAQLAQQEDENKVGCASVTKSPVARRVANPSCRASVHR